jgi:cell division protein FtsB
MYFAELMKKKKSRVPAFVLAVLLIGGMAGLVVCGGGGDKESLTKQVADYQSQAKALEQKVGDREDQIKKLETQQRELLGQLPEKHDVLPGESYWQIAHDFLTGKKNVPAETAGALLAETDLADKILAGNKVWSYYVDGVFGTFLTRGDAAVSPAWVRRQDVAAGERAKAELAAKIVDLEKQSAAAEKRFAELQATAAAQAQVLREKAAGLESDLAKSRARIGDLDARLNSVYYLAGARDALKEKGLIRGSFLGLCGDRIKRATPADFQKSLDLRGADSISVGAADVGLSKIRNVRILPRNLQEASDGGSSARITLLVKVAVRCARIIIALD